MKENIEHNLSADDFMISAKAINGKYNLLTISFPEPIREGLCYRMDIVYEEGKEDEARLFTIEKSEKNTPFLCSCVNSGEKRTHLNYNQVPKNNAKYDDTLIKIYEGSLKAMIAYTLGNDN